MASYFPLYPLTSHGINTTAEADGNDAFYMMWEMRSHINKNKFYLLARTWQLNVWLWYKKNSSSACARASLLSWEEGEGARDTRSDTETQQGMHRLQVSRSGLFPFSSLGWGWKHWLTSAAHWLCHAHNRRNFAFGHFCRFVRLQTLPCACFEVHRSILIELSIVII